MRECKHPTCGKACRRPIKEPKRYTFKRSPLKKKPGKIKHVAEKRKEQNKTYSFKRRLFLIANPNCQIKAPGCTIEATEVHHTNGRENERLLEMSCWKASCRHCNGYVEKHSQWAYDNGHKLYKHRVNNSNPKPDLNDANPNRDNDQ